jgi:hypothetical protein
MLKSPGSYMMLYSNNCLFFQGNFSDTQIPVFHKTLFPEIKITVYCGNKFNKKMGRKVFRTQFIVKFFKYS